MFGAPRTVLDTTLTATSTPPPEAEKTPSLKDPVPSLFEVIRQRRADGGGGEKPWSEPRGDGALDGGGEDRL